MRRFQRTLSVLGYWSPTCAQLSYFAEMFFPLIKVFDANLLCAAECCMTLVTNHFSTFLPHFPHPPVDYLSLVQAVLREYDPILVQTVQQWRISVVDYIWPLTRSLFTTVLHTAEWEQLMDHVMFHPPCFLVFFTAAYLHSCRKYILKAGSRTAVLALLTRHCPVSLPKALQTAHYWLLENEKPHGTLPVVPRAMYGFVPLGRDSYPRGPILSTATISSVDDVDGYSMDDFDAAPVYTDSETSDSEY
ncbi:Rab-GTPase-TBC domain [Carpediemonas membranifera]|uniref:Rab-GTPase-TBC domain n=1 Tax=Carpediemonas membranifera TaxID=201153 RepID=A0A8J6AY18_9EUKA|nr:Rab-GTPase-TBC domain [Carpediemonas membranifera]|eukprot:KAG9390049.1 Rab-GTPase-TBC domain [Carpediemonas membranifera]